MKIQIMRKELEREKTKKKKKKNTFREKRKWSCIVCCVSPVFSLKRPLTSS